MRPLNTFQHAGCYPLTAKHKVTSQDCLPGGNLASLSKCVGIEPWKGQERAHNAGSQSRAVPSWRFSLSALSNIVCCATIHSCVLHQRGRVNTLLAKSRQQLPWRSWRCGQFVDFVQLLTFRSCTDGNYRTGESPISGDMDAFGNPHFLGALCTAFPPEGAYSEDDPITHLSASQVAFFELLVSDMADHPELQSSKELDERSQNKGAVYFFLVRQMICPSFSPE